ncbi:MAG: ATPase [Sphingomonadaceae bacterium]|nr:ATPase [Sphingomonadaceae bacterium]
MARTSRILLIGLAIVLTGVALAAELPRALTVAIALAAGLIAMRALRRTAVEDDAAPAAELALAAQATSAAELAAILQAIDEPLLVVEGRRVAQANAAARAVLGEHIVEEDARVALRHPAAADRITGAAPGDRPIELVGIGERDRRWELRVHPLGPTQRLVRLADRTGVYATERMRVDFVANASHELRTPLAAILGLIETLEDANGPGDETVRARFLSVMLKEARRMQRLIDDLLSLSRIEADKYRAPQDRVALAPLAAEVADACRAGAAEPPKIMLDVAPGLPDAAGDRAQLSQLLHNLVGNALKYGKPGGPVRIAIKAPSPGMLSLAVADEGDGVPPEHLPRLTERFYRVDPGRSRAGGGTGLGLAIVKHIVERHRGRLDIASAIGKGTTVTVLLPQATVEVLGERLSA